MTAGLNGRLTSQLFAAFEPEPEAFHLLNENLARNGLTFFKTSNCALGTHTGTTTLYVSTTANQGNHSLFQRQGTRAQGECPLSRLGEALTDEAWLGPLLVKTDVEGAEPRVLEGGAEWLTRHEELELVCEVSAENLGRSGFTRQGLFELLSRMGFTDYCWLEQRPLQLCHDPMVGGDLTRLANLLALGDERSVVTFRRWADAVSISDRPRSERPLTAS